MKPSFTYLFLLLFVFATSCDLSDDADSKDINNWVYHSLNDNYFWYNKIGKPNIPAKQDPEDYFNSLLYKTEDHWSFITSDYKSLESELDGKPTSMGYSPSFGLITGTSDVFMIIEYVYPNSPASIAGLKRGDIVLKINDTQLNKDNYIDLYYGTTQTLTLASYSPNGLSLTNRQLSMSAATLKVNPVIFDTVFNINSIKTGYCVITEFISSNEFNKRIDETFAKFKSAGITNLIVDLRYNGGGYITSAQWLASSIVKSNVAENKSILTTLTYSDKVEAIMATDDKEIRYTSPNVSLNLDKAYFLTASGTASASELVIVGLQPYIQVITIGENTYGKYTGMWLISDDNNPPKHNYAMMPVVMKYANAVGYTDFVDGLDPTFKVEDNLFYAVPFGDITDPVLSQALTFTNGLMAKSARIDNSPVFTNLKIPKREFQHNLFISRK